jgi:trans-aconitate 2-methyltransferase
MPGKRYRELSKLQRNFYDNYAKRQVKVGVNLRHISIRDRILRHGFDSNWKVLEIGCGIGTLTGLLSGKLSTGNILGIDLSPKSIEIAKQKFKNRDNIEFLSHDILLSPLESSVFDCIVLADVLEHIPIPNHQDLFATMDSMLGPGGKVYINIPSPHYLKWCHENCPELLQAIDQPITLDVLTNGMKDTDLIIDFMESYSVWVRDRDYQFIVLRKNHYQDFSVNIRPRRGVYKYIIDLFGFAR